MTLRPVLASNAAQESPPMPEPMTTTSVYSSVVGGCGGDGAGGVGMVEAQGRCHVLFLLLIVVVVVNMTDVLIGLLATMRVFVVENLQFIITDRAQTTKN